MEWPLFWIFAASFLWPITLSLTENPARIPLGRILLRAAPGLFLCGITGFGVTISAWILFVRLLSSGPSILRQEGSLLLLGLLAVVQLMIVKDALFRAGSRRRFEEQLFAVVQAFDEVSRLYVRRIATREERKLDLRFSESDYGTSVDNAFRAYAV